MAFKLRSNVARVTGCPPRVMYLVKASRMRTGSTWAKGYCANTVGLDEERIRKYIREQEKLESRQGDLDLS